MGDPANPPEGCLLRVYPPDGAEDKTSVDIIAIHGLGTTTPRTWEHKTKTGAVNWLSDSNMLPDVVPSARIYTFSWNANYVKDAPVTRIVNVADILLSNLKRYRDQDRAHLRPLVFVASCFGGLIVTKALETANIHDSAYRKLLIATSGVVFLGSPLQGTRAGNAAQWHAMISGILGRYPSETLLQDLDGSTRALRETTHNFANMIRTPPMQMMTICFWETQKSQVLKAVLPARLPKLALKTLNSTKVILVEEDSATIIGHENKPLDAPHSRMNKFSGPNDANFGLVSDAIKIMVKEAKRIAVRQREASYLHNEHFMVSRRLNPLFTGREEELEKLKQALCPSLSISAHIAAPKVYVIYGMGGAGKSEVALKFAHDSRLEFWGIFWIDGRSESSITNGFATIARTCGHHDESREGVILWLQNTSHSWLLILDNADNKDMDMAQFLPAGTNGRILITTRLIECAKLNTVGKDHYERLNEETAVNLLLKACEIELGSRSDREDDARAVAELLGCHALAVIQAGAAISQNMCSLREYKDIFQDQRQVLLECFPGQAKSEYGGVYATFEVSATYLKARDNQAAKDALQLLNFYAFMHFSEFPEIAFEEAWTNSNDEAVVSSEVDQDGEEHIYSLAPCHVIHLPTFMQKNTHDIDLNKLRVRNARSLLVSLSLVTFDAARGMTRMHPVSHFWSRDRLQEPEEYNTARLNGISVLSLSIKNPYTPDVLPLYGQLQPHIESLTQSLKGCEYPRHNLQFQQSLYRLGYVLFRLGCDPALFELLQLIPIQNDESWLRTENGQKIQLLHGRWALGYGDVNMAVNLLEKLSEAQLQTLLAEDPKCLVSQHELALAYLKQEDMVKAIASLERILHIRNQTLRPEHPHRLASQHELARAFLKIGETAKAIALLEEVVEIQTKTLNLEHPRRLTSQHGLAIAYLYIGETAKAMGLLEKVVKIGSKTLRPEHPDRLTSQHGLAIAYLKIGETTKAIALLEEVVKLQTITLRPEHQDRLISQHELARAYLGIGETAKAIVLLESVVEIKAKTLRADHPDSVSSIYVLALCHYRARNYERALELARSIEGVAQNRPGRKIADWNVELIGRSLEKMELA